MTENLRRMKISDMAGADALGRLDGRVVFLRGGAPGDVVLVELVEERKSFARGRLHAVLEAGPERVEPRCPHYGHCGGCDWQHLSAESQLRHKAALLVDQARKIGGLELEPPDIAPSTPWAYRDRARLQTVWRHGRPRLGYYAAGSRHLVAFESCPLWREPLPAALDGLRKALDGPLGRAGGWHQLEAVELETLPEGWALCLRFSRPTPPRLPWDDLVRSLDGLRGLRVTGTERGAVVHGPPRLALGTGPASPRKTPGVFSQPNGDGARWLADVLAEIVSRSRPAVLWDLYGGYGPLAAAAAPLDGLWLVEADPAAVEDAAHNLRDAADRVVVTEGLVEDALAHGIPTELPQPDLVVLDPPRSGLKPGVAGRLVELAPPAILYVACNPARFWRDARLLLDGGYALGELRVFDMLPQTHHLELTALFTR